MAPTRTDAIVLHVFDYLETSRILRLLTREAGVQSVLAKGARRNRAKYGSAVDLFAEGEAEVYLKASRDLHTLASFDVMRSRSGLATDMGRFLAAAAIAELVLRIGRDEAAGAMYDTVSDALATLEQTSGETAIAAAGVAAVWRIVAAAGFAPAVEVCASCHTPIDPDARVLFSSPAGGVVCSDCARMHPAGRALPGAARATLSAWLRGESGNKTGGTLELAEVKAHRRLAREFIHEHIAGDRALQAYSAWEQG